MSNKENAFVTPHMANGELSNEQKDRISQHFRAAKAILARKRPPDCGNFPKQFPQGNGHANMFKAPARDSSINRVHLAEIPMNTPSPLALKGSNFTNGECRSNLFTAGMYIKRDDSIKEVPMSTLSPFSVKGLHFSDGECGRSLSTAGTYVKRNDSINEIPMNTPSPFPVEGLNFSDGECGSSLSTAGVFVKRNDSINGLCTSKSIRRVPLAEVPMNTPSPFALKGFNLTDGEYGSYSCITGISINMSDSIDDCLHPSTSIKRVAHAELPTKTVSQVRPLECSTMRDSLLFSSVLDDDDFDESILEEIDALCEQKSAEKSERGYLNGDLQRQFDDRRWENNTISQPIATKEILNSEGTLKSGNEAQFIAEQSSELKEMENGSMPEEYSKYFQSLNDMQREAACSDISIPLMIIAGPGSGKTSTMVGRVLMLLNEGIGPSNILAMTFTTAAASEMRDRIGVVTGKATAKELLVSTFHSFSLQLCRSHAEKLGRTQEFLVYGHGQQRRAVIEAMRLLGDEKRDQNHDSEKLGEDSNGNSVPLYLKDKSKKWQKFVAQAKASGKTPDECRKTGDEMGAAILGNYNDILRSCNALDYHDLISCSVKLLTDFPEVIKECQESYKAIIVDEFQDTSGMQYSLMRTLASHSHITIVGDDDQSIFSFNGADISGFNSFRNDFPNHKEIRLNKNYRSTRCIVEAASSLIQNNSKRCQLKRAITDNSSGSKITIKECHNEDAQCSFVVDKILEATSDGSAAKCSYGNIAVLYRRQASGKLFQTVFRDRKIPFNIHGVAFYRKKAVKAIIAMLRTTLPGCDDGPHRQVFKALLPFEKEEKKRVIEHIDKISTIRKYSFISTARNIFSAKISGSFKRNQLTQGRKVLSTLEMISKLVHREQSISAVITSVANMLPQKYLLEQRAVADVDGGKLLNEDNDLRSVLRYLLDDVSCFLSSHFFAMEEKRDIVAEGKGCVDVLKAFIDYITERERENFRSRRHDNAESVTLTTIHQSKGLEWDTVFIVKANDSEIPLLHEFNGVARENGTSVEEERRLLYVAMTRARKKLFILYVTLDSNWQLLQPSRFLKEIPYHLREIQAESSIEGLKRKHQDISKDSGEPTLGVNGEQFSKMATVANNSLDIQIYDTLNGSTEPMEACNGNNFLRRFNVDDRATVSHLFHQWAKKKAFQDPRRLLDKVGFVIDERLAVKKFQHKEVLRSLKTCLKSEDAFHYAEYILRWEQIPADQRAHLLREKQEHFQKLRIEKTMSSSAPTPKQISFLQSLGCTTTPSSRLHASRLIEEYKSL